MKVMRVREREILRGVACRRGLPLPDERCPLLSTMRVRWRVLRTCPDVSFFQTSRASAEMSVMFHKREQLRGGGNKRRLRVGSTSRHHLSAEAGRRGTSKAPQSTQGSQAITARRPSSEEARLRGRAGLGYKWRVQFASSCKARAGSVRACGSLSRGAAHCRFRCCRACLIFAIKSVQGHHDETSNVRS